jgi:putative Mg2+ transporter-C (MgtC) family protein
MSEQELIVRLIVALGCGGLVGIEREIKGHAAGLRTYMLVSLGSALFLIAGELITQRYASLIPALDPTRIASNIVTGVGFLGAGMIFQSRNRVRNLTTAASIWVVAAIGLLAGAGLLLAAGLAAVLATTVLAGLPPVEGWLRRRFAPAGPLTGAGEPSNEEATG